MASLVAGLITTILLLLILLGWMAWCWWETEADNKALREDLEVAQGWTERTLIAEGIVESPPPPPLLTVLPGGAE